MYAKKITKNIHIFFVFLYQNLSFIIHVKQNLTNEYVEENQSIFNHSYHDIYQSIMIYISGTSELNSSERAGQIETDLGRYRDRFR